MTGKRIHLSAGLVLTGLAMACFAHPSQGAREAVLNHQGLIFVDGAAYDGVGKFKFAITHADLGGARWLSSGDKEVDTEPTMTIDVTVVRGRHSVALGDPALGMNRIHPGGRRAPNARPTDSRPYHTAREAELYLAELEKKSRYCRKKVQVADRRKLQAGIQSDSQEIQKWDRERNAWKLQCDALDLEILTVLRELARPTINNEILPQSTNKK